MQNQFDFIIVGAGTAGCLLANRLSANPDKQVLLLEAGGRDNYHWVHIPVGYLYCIGNPRTDWLYKTANEPGLNGRSLVYPRGKVLGGCSSINGMIYMRGQARDYDHWANVTGENAWSWSACLPDFLAHEDHSHGHEETDGATFHATGGEWRVDRQRLRWELLDAFQEAAVEAGIKRTDDFNRGDNEGVGYFEVNQRDGFRWNTRKAFIEPVKSRSNLTVWTGAHVRELTLERMDDGTTRCKGVRLQMGGETRDIAARHEVIMSAGAIGTPQIMQLSGMGDPVLLQDFGIECRVERRGIGRNLQDHLQLRTIYRVEGVKTLNETAGSLWGKMAIGLEYALKRTGPMSMAPSQLGLFTKSSPEREHANIQFHVQPLSLEAFGQPLHPWPGLTASVCNLNPTSRGTVTLSSNRFDDQPIIQPNYLDTEEDKTVAAQSLRVTRNIVSQPALSAFKPDEVKPGLNYQSDDELAKAAGDIGTTIFHPVGTTRMGRADDPDSVVDSRLRVIGVSRLRVVDAGIMPTITSGNTNSPTLMIAEKAAAWINEAY